MPNNSEGHKLYALWISSILPISVKVIFMKRMQHVLFSSRIIWDVTTQTSFRPMPLPHVKPVCNTGMFSPLFLFVKSSRRFHVLRDLQLNIEENNINNNKSIHGTGESTRLHQLQGVTNLAGLQNQPYLQTFFLTIIYGESISPGFWKIRKLFLLIFKCWATCWKMYLTLTIFLDIIARKLSINHTKLLFYFHHPDF